MDKGFHTQEKNHAGPFSTLFCNTAKENWSKVKNIVWSYSAPS